MKILAAFCASRQACPKIRAFQALHGMSSDYQTAIEFGATSVRVGSAIFGNRAYQQNA